MEDRRKLKRYCDRIIANATIRPIDRSRHNKQIIYDYLSKYVERLSNIPKVSLFKLSEASVIEQYEEANLPVLAINGIFIILSGSAKVINGPSEMMRANKQMRINDTFGDFSLENKDENRNDKIVLLTLEPLVMLKLPSFSYQRITEMRLNDKLNDRLGLLQSCSFFNGWPLISIKEFASVIVWKNITNQNMILKENDSSPCLYIIKSGECLKLKKLLITDKGTNVVSRHLVPIGQLSIGGYFGEQSVSLLSYKIKINSVLELACISKYHISEMDQTTQDLFRQTSSNTNDSISKDEVEKIFVDQEFRHQWNDTKDGVIKDVLRTRNIIHGYSKWSRNFKDGDEL